MSGFGHQPAAPDAAPTGGAAPGPDRNLVLAGIAGAALVLVGSLLAWSSVSFPDGTATGTESSGGTNGDGLWTLIAAIVTAALLAGALVRRQAALALASIVPTLVILVVVVVNVLNPERTLRAEGESEGASAADIDMVLELVDVSAGVGIWIALVGAVVALGSAALAGLKARA